MSEKLLAGLQLMVFGMGMVYVFLIIMIFCMKIMSRIVAPIAARQKAAEEARKAKELAAAKEAAAKLDMATVTVTVKSGESGKIFGSVTSKEIAEELKKQGYDVDKKNVMLPEPIKQLGRQTVEVKLYAGVKTKINVVVVGEK